MKIARINDVILEDLVKVLKKGGLIIYPTETLYGVGVDATNDKAVGKLNKYKKRPTGKPYSIAVSDEKMAGEYVHLDKASKKIYKTFLPGPITVVSKGKHKTAKGIESESGTLGIRIPDYKLVRDVVKKFGKPITATSANASYKKRPYKIADVLDNLSASQKKLIDLIIDAGELPHNEPSTVVDTTGGDLTILRQGEVSLKNKNEILSKSPENTKNFAKELWQKYENYFGKRAIIFALTGEMGTGKTIFTKGLAKAMGISENVTSPTFNLEQKYASKNQKINLFHIDAWRLHDSSEIEDFGFSKHLSDKSVMAIEWADKIAEVIKKADEEAIIIWVNLVFEKTENERVISWGVTK